MNARGLGRFETFLWLAARSPAHGLAQVPSADLDIPVLGQLAPAQLPLGDALEPGPLKVERLDSPLRGAAPGGALEDAPRTPEDTAVFSDLDPELDGLLRSSGRPRGR